ncbi:hypothetical protein [Azospirillum doebereinerae]
MGGLGEGNGGKQAGEGGTGQQGRAQSTGRGKTRRHDDSRSEVGRTHPRQERADGVQSREAG